jgi:deoxypyrimidine-specific 5' nucleotidase type C protein (NT5C)
MGIQKYVSGVDLDGVCADFYSGLRLVAAEWLGVQLKSLPTEVSYGLKEWKLDALGGYEELHRYAVTQKELFNSLLNAEKKRPGVTERARASFTHLALYPYPSSPDRSKWLKAYSTAVE